VEKYYTAGKATYDKAYAHCMLNV